MREIASQARGDYNFKSVIRFAPTAKNAASAGADQLDKAGQTILRLLHEAAGVAEANGQRAIESTRSFHQLRAAEARIAELEVEIGAYQERADRAEEWLHRVYTEIEDRFLQQIDSRRAMSGAPQRPQSARRRAD